MANEAERKRHLDLDGSYNIRDIGGYPTTDGSRTRWQTLLRSDSLHRLPPASQAALLDYGVRTIIDLRTSDAVQSHPNVFEGSADVTYYHQNLIGDDELPAGTESIESGALSKAISSSYCVWLDHRRSQICETVATLASPAALPALVHCAGGKDRTGIITALALGLAGVPVETIAEDYALSGRYLFSRYIDANGAAEVEASGYTWQDYQREYCPPEVMLSTLEYLEERYGGVEGYVVGGGLSGAQIETLRRALVE